MADLAEKIDKQLAYQRTLYGTRRKAMDLFVSTDNLTAYLANQMRAEPDRLRVKVKVELERRADAGELIRWTERYGQSYRADRADHYFLKGDAASD